MARKSNEIKIIIDKLSASGLTYDEQKVALKKVLFSVSK